MTNFTIGHFYEEHVPNTHEEEVDTAKFILTRTEDEYGPEVRVLFSSDVNIDDFLSHMTDFMRGAGYIIDQGEIVFCPKDKDIVTSPITESASPTTVTWDNYDNTPSSFNG